MVFRMVAAASAVLTVVTAHVGAVAAPSAPAISAEEFAAPPFFHDPELSPDGRKLVAKSVAAGVTSLMIADLAKDDLGIARKNLPENRVLLWSRWAGDHRIVFSVFAMAKVFGIEVPTTRLFLWDLQTSAIRSIGAELGGLDGDDLVHVDPAGRFLLLSGQKSMSDYPGVWRVDLATMTAAQVVKPHPEVWNWYADPEGVVRAGIGVQGRRWWVLYRGPGENKFKKIVKGSAKEDQKSDIDRVIPLAGSDQGFAIANKQTGRYAVYAYDFANDKLGEPLFEHPEVDVDSVTYSPFTGRMEAIEYTDDRDRIHWLDPEMKAVQARVDQTFPNSINRIVSKSHDGKIMLVWSGGASDPGAYYVYDTAGKQMRELVRPYDAIDREKLAAVKPVRYKARDGVDIPAYLTLPSGGNIKGLPLIVMPHGGPFLRDKWSYDPWVQFLASRGYAVLQPNFRGSTGYGRAFVEAGEGEWGRKMQDDVDDGARWLAAEGTVDPRRVCVMGASYGGYVAMWAAARNPELYRCAISFAGISDVRAMLSYDSRSFSARRYYRDWRDRVKGQGKFDLESISPLRAANRISIPLLIAHGADDTNVPASQSTKLHDALLKVGRAHDYVIYKGEGHSLSDPKNHADFLKRLEAFLARHNPAG